MTKVTKNSTKKVIKNSTKKVIKNSTKTVTKNSDTVNPKSKFISELRALLKRFESSNLVKLSAGLFANGAKAGASASKKKVKKKP